MTKKRFIERARRGGLEIHKNNIKEAKPLDKVCSRLANKYPASPEKLLDR